VPTYQYACTECSEQLEVQQSFTDDPLTQCPVCSGRLRKVFNAVGVVFKGSGFYRTDSRANANGKRDGAAASGDGSAGDGSGTKSDKPAAANGADKGNGAKPDSSATPAKTGSTATSGSGSSSAG
jgi:putative FmdB family regulatory protein